MMNVDDYLGADGNWYKAAEHSKDEKVTIVGIEEGTDYDGNKCLNLGISDDRKIALKRRNIRELSSLFGKDADEWIDKEVGLELTETEYEGKKYPGFKFVPADDLPF